jgi:hypothetical protein
MIVETRVRGRVPVPDGMGLYKYQQVFCVCARWEAWQPEGLRHWAEAYQFGQAGLLESPRTHLAPPPKPGILGACYHAFVFAGQAFYPVSHPQAATTG